MICYAYRICIISYLSVCSSDLHNLAFFACLFVPRSAIVPGGQHKNEASLWRIYLIIVSTAPPLGNLHGPFVLFLEITSSGDASIGANCLHCIWQKIFSRLGKTESELCKRFTLLGISAIVHSHALNACTPLTFFMFMGPSIVGGPPPNWRCGGR